MLCNCHFRAVSGHQGGHLTRAPDPLAVLSEFPEAAIRRHAGEASVRRGVDYVRRGAVLGVTVENNVVVGMVRGSEAEPYRASIVVHEGDIVDAYCTCAFSLPGWCKHIVATILGSGPGAAVEPDATPDTPERPGPGRKQRARQERRALRRRLHPYEPVATRRFLRAALRSLDGMLPSQAYWHVGKVAAEIAEVIAEAAARHAAGARDDALAELTLITKELVGVFERLDDSDGEVGALVARLGATWMRVFLEADLSPKLRERFLTSMSDWHAHFDDSGAGEDFSGALSALEHGWDTDGPPLLVAAKLEILEASGRDVEFLALALRAGAIVPYALKQIALGAAGVAEAALQKSELDDADVLLIGRALVERGETARAVSIVQRALGPPRPKDDLFGGAAHDRAELARWLSRIAEAHGEASSAVDAAIAALQAEPTARDLARLQQLAGAKQAREVALDAIRAKPAPESRWEAVTIALQLGAIDDAIELVEQRGYFRDERILMEVAVAAVDHRPAWSIELARRSADVAIRRGDGSSYRTASRWLRVAARAYRAAGRESEWRNYRDELLAKYRARRTLVPLIAAIVSD